MLLIKCLTCEKEFWVKGYTTPNSWMESGEVVTDLECDDPLCNCLNDGDDFEVLDEEYETFPDDV